MTQPEFVGYASWEEADEARARSITVKPADLTAEVVTKSEFDDAVRALVNLVQHRMGVVGTGPASLRVQVKRDRWEAARDAVEVLARLGFAPSPAHERVKPPPHVLIDGVEYAPVTE